ncbi:uncharacterized protein I303_103759 [Kwoniella dejecticola CBS 10117]|uniref:Uncharacterized protein n=1 Tax=Kwoniella dejecticola CBS 10117 TaxID=1296121 RepID=A0A1A6A7M5_9TREE|nr:uncharacterized protein I303_03777 [Kwoniella dejecticola CBS 10117]OBR86059.1 hypothetical protein I303_03777 [Kwoniella dejecticola CBS 10117]
MSAWASSQTGGPLFIPPSCIPAFDGTSHRQDASAWTDNSDFWQRHQGGYDPADQTGNVAYNDYSGAAHDPNFAQLVWPPMDNTGAEYDKLFEGLDNPAQGEQASEPF